MRCKKHLSDLSSSVGVCASCLRERLFALIAAQVQAQAEERRKSDSHPPPLVFPRSVSPYVCRRSDDSSWHHNHFDQRFYSTPQVGPTSNSAAHGRKKKHSKFSLLTSLFTSRSKDHRHEADDEHQSRVSRFSRDSISSSSSSPISSSWFSSILPSRSRKKQSRLFSLDETATATAATTTTTTTCSRRPCRARDRGMSPSKGINEGKYYEDYEVSPSASGYSSDASQSRWKYLMTAPAVRRREPPQHNRNVSGLAFCLSPLVRASANTHRNNGFSGDMGFSGEIRVPSNKPHHLSTAASFCANRSRKLADFGRYDSFNH
ncbi:PREDICTED: vitellogenin-like [Nelumbo nucifera]|uniref:Vitellogenin-like n=2 Tax=Nelumbo nucifera TaxID=4432 RepID=A0A822XKY7_NELNU|nr:PREDICTED: vitellogenin-like [Nelumbo nucifera]DAD18208.1 TPA_asm: hypothetical protein HUJ06_019671 [Nelumbo nucifera]